MIKETFPYYNDALIFNSKKHEYRLNGVKLLNVTSWLNQFEEPFNPYRVSEAVSKNKNSEYYGMEPSEIRDLWAKTGPRGTKKHNTIEDWLNGKEKNCIEQSFLENLNITPKNSWPEVILCSEKLLLSGTADIITQIDDNIFKIWDIKTSTKIGKEKLEKFSKQVLTYGLLLKHMTDDPIKIIPGGIISIVPIDDISEGVNYNFKDPTLIEIDMNVRPAFVSMVKQREEEIYIQKT